MDAKTRLLKTKKFICIKCDFNSNKKIDYKRHTETIKHIGCNMDADGCIKNSCEIFSCNCGKVYKYRQGLGKHKKTCNYNIEEGNKQIKNINKPKEESCNSDIITELLKQNNEFKSLLADQHKYIVEQNKHIIELVGKGVGNMTNSNNTTNNKFNLNFFLHEQCKDAMNITDFVNSLQLQLSDLENVGELGYAAGISKIFINGLKQLDIFKRPIHCSDIKRETMYIKDKDAWEKENQEREKMMWAIKNIAHKNVKQIPEWQQENPEYKDGESETNGQFLKIVSESMGGYTKEDDNANYNKIIRNVAKEVSIDKI